MTLWCALNGWQGYGQVGALVEAETEAEARERAIAAFRDAEPNKPDYWRIKRLGRVSLPFVGDELPWPESETADRGPENA